MDDYDNARAERDFRLNPPQSSPVDGDDWDSLPTGSSSVGSESSFSGSNANDGNFNINSVLNGNDSQSQNNTQIQQQYLTPEFDALWGTAKTAFHVVSVVCREFGRSFMNNTKSDWRKLGKRAFVFGGCTAGVGLFFTLLKPFVPSIREPWWLGIGGLLAVIVGLVLIMFIDADGGDVVQNVVEETPVASESPAINSYNSQDIDDMFAGLDDEVGDDTSDSSDYDGIDWDSMSDEFADDFSEPEEEYADNSNCAGSDGFDAEKAVEGVVAEKGIWTRQYLFETFKGILPSLNPGYARTVELDYNDSEFMMFSEYIRTAARQYGCKEENLPDLMRMTKNLFLYRLECTRSPGLKEEDIANEVANMYSRDENGKVVNEKTYATTDSSGDTFVINLFTGENCMVSLKDIYNTVPDYILNTDVKMPYIWGINEFGDVLKCDLEGCESMLFCGETRCGKSWKGQSVLAQICMFSSPKEVEFYIFDPKGMQSDYYYPSKYLPHVRFFCGEPKKMVGYLDRLFKYVEDTTGKALKEAGLLNIADYNKKFPMNKLPYRYILVDELMTLMTKELDKDDGNKFQDYLSSIVSKYAYFGIRVILFPHRIVNDVIRKNTYTLISSRAVVRQLSEDEVKASIGVTRKQFPYHLCNKGDMGIVSRDINNGKATFCHAEVLSGSNNANFEIFEFIGGVWKRLVPEIENIEFDETGLVGGSIGIPVAVRLAEKREVIDHTAGKESYKYNPKKQDDKEDVFAGENSDLVLPEPDVDESWLNDIL